MAREADIVPLPLRKSPSTSVSEPNRGEVPWIAVVVGATLLSFVAVALATTRDQHAVARIASERRAGIFKRAYTDLVETCRLLDALSGPLRQHCIDQAGFVLLFPECDKACDEVARNFLPHATR
jgi:hypothetical protein